MELTIATGKQNELIDITSQINRAIPQNLKCGICLIHCPHTTAGLTVNENADPDVRHDLDKLLDRMAPEGEPYYRHTLEGLDDMPAHAKSVVTGVSLTIPITAGRLNLGTWQGIYLCEFRDEPSPRHIVATVMGD